MHPSFRKDPAQCKLSCRSSFQKNRANKGIPLGVFRRFTVLPTILSFATTPFTDTNVFEASHRPNVKDLQDSTVSEQKESNHEHLQVSRQKHKSIEAQPDCFSAKQLLGETEQGESMVQVQEVMISLPWMIKDPGPVS